MDELPDDIESLLRLSESGNKQATLHCAFYYESVDDMDKANHYYELAADSGYPEAQFFMGYRLENGFGGPVDLVRANKYYKLSADNGNGDAQYRYSKNLREGKGVEKDEKAADHYLELARSSHKKMVQEHSQLPDDFDSLKLLADNEQNPRAMLAVAYHYESSGDIDNANKYYRMSADHGSAEAQLVMGVRLENGINIEKNCKEALIFYRESSKNGNRDAKTRVEQIEHPERHLELFDAKTFAGLPDDVPQLLTLAGKGNHKAGMRAAMILDMDGKHEEARKYWERSANSGDVNAQLLLGMKLEYGVNIEADVEKANELYLKSSRGGNKFAMFRLGMNLLSGSGVAKNLTEGNKWLKKSADLGNKSAQLAFAANLETGTGIAVNKEEAERYKELASKQK